jgi:hypothetical protein
MASRPNCDSPFGANAGRRLANGDKLNIGFGMSDGILIPDVCCVSEIPNSTHSYLSWFGEHFNRTAEILIDLATGAGRPIVNIAPSSEDVLPDAVLVRTIGEAISRTLI